MESKIIGKIGFEDDLIQPEIAEIDRFHAANTYSEYVFGTWHSHVLANGSGDHRDTEFRHYDGSPRETELGQRLPYLMKVMRETFVPDRVRWIRIFTLRNGVLITHRDFVESKRPSIRLNIPIRTGEQSLHSESEDVFHAHKGEIVYLHAVDPHAACCYDKTARLSVCVDLDGDQLEGLLLSGEQMSARPELIKRPPLTADELESLYGLGAILNPNNVADVIRLFAHVHFYRRVQAASCFDWLIEAARRSRHPELVPRAMDYRRYCLEQRAYGERFRW